ncbi:MAG: hypothetical protein PHC61_19245, partial [Chitinivibrionales bacterium]|nr:hypothetical protein [Chitinivibrionales bacterium]
MNNPFRFVAFYYALLISGAFLSVDATVAILDNQTDEGLSCYKITSQSATYYYDKNGGGFSSILDKDGNDWVGWHSGTSQANGYRGIPNPGSIGFHPGYPNDGGGGTGCTSTIISQATNKVTIQSSTSAGSKMQWDFYDDHATLTVVSASASYRIGYEGTPGGTDGLPSDGFYYKSDGVKHAITDLLGGSTDVTVLPDPEWIFFGGNGLNRVLLLIHQTHDNIADNYWAMNGVGVGNMTVFGFGRTNHSGAGGLTAANNVFHFALVESNIFAT